ncbi:MAG: hypothetical protein HY588_00700 [Candidatus Omnitrophica bacterium]|nr:hypothetical protein [Candidatus Omnitrophota bacterium]
MFVIPAQAPVGQAAVGRSVIRHRSVGTAGIQRSLLWIPALPSVGRNDIGL